MLDAERARAWIEAEIRRHGRMAQPSEQGFPSAASLVTGDLPATVAVARDFYREALFDFGSAWAHRFDVDGEPLLAVYAGTDGDDGALELFSADGTALAAAWFDADIHWSSTDEARARLTPPSAGRLVVLGASGGVGAHLVTAGIAHGWTVTSVARASSKGAADRRGDLCDVGFLREVFRGADAIASGLGLRIAGLGPWNRPEIPDFLSRSGAAIVEAMKAEGVRRLIAISAAGVDDSRSRVPLLFRAAIPITALRFVYAELAILERILLDSGLDVCVARPGALVDAPATHRARAVERLNGAGRIARADVADWMIRQLAVSPFAHRVTLIE